MHFGTSTVKKLRNSALCNISNLLSALLLSGLLLLMSVPQLHAQAEIRAGELVISLKKNKTSTQSLGLINSIQSATLVNNLGNHQALVEIRGLAPETQAVGKSIPYAPNKLTYDAACQELLTKGVAESCSPNFIYHVSATPNDTYYSLMAGLSNISAPAAWEISTGSNSITVAVIDTGIEYTHADLTSNMWTNSGEIPSNGIDDDGNGYVDDYYGANFISARTSDDPLDDNGHGTHCAGTIGAVGNNSRGVVGVNWKVKLMALKFLDFSGSGSTSDAIAAINYAVEKGAKVISASWGGPGYSAPLEDAIRSAGSHNVLFVAAAGNESTDNDNSVNRSYPASYSLSNLIAVASSDASDQFSSSFSNYGATSVHVAAPGEDIASTYIGNQYAYLTGTSMATPHVAGLAALVLSVKSLSASAIKNLIIAHVDTLASLQGKVSSGGRINAYATLVAASGETPTPTPTATPIPGTSPTPTPTPTDGGGGGGGGGVNDDSPNFTVTSGAYDVTTKVFSPGKRVIKNGLIQIGLENSSTQQAATLRLKIHNVRCKVGEFSVNPSASTSLSCKALSVFRGRAYTEVYDSNGILAASEPIVFAPSTKTANARAMSSGTACKKLAKQIGAL